MWKTTAVILKEGQGISLDVRIFTLITIFLYRRKVDSFFSYIKKRVRR